MSALTHHFKIKLLHISEYCRVKGKEEKGNKVLKVKLYHTLVLHTIPGTTTMTKRNSRPLIDPVRVGENIGNNQQTMKRQRSSPAAPDLFSNGNGRSVKLQPQAEKDGYGEEEQETSGSIKRKITKRAEDESVQIIFDTTNTGKVPERKPEKNVPKLKDAGNIF